MIGRANDTLQKNARFLLAHLFGSVEAPSENSVFVQELRACGTRMVKECRHGTAAFSAEKASLALVDSVDSPSRTARQVNPSEPEKPLAHLQARIGWIEIISLHCKRQTQISVTSSWP